MAAEGNSFVKMTGPGQACIYLLSLACALSLPSLSGKDNALIYISNPLQKGETSLTVGSITRSFNLFTMSEIPWYYLQLISF